MAENEASDSIAIACAEVSKRFGARWALSRVSVEIARGSCVLLSGPNGAGKTTLLRVIAGATSPTRGAVHVLGDDVRTCRTAVRQRVGFLSHASYLYEDLSAEENLQLEARLLGGTHEVDAVLEQVGLRDRKHSRVRTFSAGMRKRLSMARILLKNPQVSLLDEPFGELDRAGVASMERCILELGEGGRTVVLATHLIDLAANVCSRTLVLRAGLLEETT